MPAVLEHLQLAAFHSAVQPFAIVQQQEYVAVAPEDLRRQVEIIEVGIDRGQVLRVSLEPVSNRPQATIIRSHVVGDFIVAGDVIHAGQAVAAFHKSLGADDLKHHAPESGIDCFVDDAAVVRRDNTWSVTHQDAGGLVVMMDDVMQRRRHTHVGPDNVYVLESQFIDELFDEITLGLEAHVFHTAFAAPEPGLAECLVAQEASGGVDILHSTKFELLNGALEILHERLADTPNSKQLCDELQVNARWLRRVFKEAFGVGPIAFSRLMRINQARRNLKSARGSEETVAGIARRYGFNRLGAFADEYRRQFGELPSETLGVRGHPGVRNERQRR